MGQPKTTKHGKPSPKKLRLSGKMLIVDLSRDEDDTQQGQVRRRNSQQGDLGTRSLHDEELNDDDKQFDADFGHAMGLDGSD